MPQIIPIWKCFIDPFQAVEDLARERDPLSQQSIGANELDKVDHENTTFDTEGEAAKRFQNALKIASEVFLVAFTKTAAGGKKRIKMKFRKLDVIAAFLLIQDLLRNSQFKFDKSFTQKLASHILADRDATAVGKATSGPVIAKYYDEWRAKIIEEIGVRLDPKRLFDEADKQIIYERAQGRCGICSEPVDRSDAEYDQFPLPHALGGKTVVENGRLVHAACHPRGPVEANAESDGARSCVASVDPATVEATAIKEIIADVRRRGKTITEDQVKKILARRLEIEADFLA